MPLTLSKRAQVIPQVKISPPENLVLDNLVTRPAATFNLRRTTRHYDGAMVLVRGDASIVSQREFKSDIRGELDIRALLAFVGNGSGFVVRWNNSNGNGTQYDVSQPTSSLQPQIVGNQIFARTGQELFKANEPTFLSADGQYLLNMVHDVINPSIFTTPFPLLVRNYSTAVGDASRRPLIFYFKANSALFHTHGTSSISEPTANILGKRVLSFTRDLSAFRTFVDGNLSGSAVGVIDTTGTHSIFAIGNSDTGSVPLQYSEVVLFAGATSNADRQILERDQAKYFSITGVA